MAIVRPWEIVKDSRHKHLWKFVQLMKVMDEYGSNVKFVGNGRACEFAPLKEKKREAV